MNNKRKRLTLKNAIIFITLLLTFIILALGTIKLVQILKKNYDVVSLDGEYKAYINYLKK